jgi:hypothetical protein
MARAAQHANLDRDGDTTNVPGTDGEVLAAMRDLYRLIAPEETGEVSAPGPPRDWGCGSKRVPSGSLIGERRQRGLDREAGKHRGRGR